MYPRQFEYIKANSVEEAIQALQSNEDAKILAGGHSLLPAMKLRLASPAVLVDISKIAALKNVSVNGSATIGAGATYDEILQNSGLRESHTALYEAMAKVGDVQVRNLGTLGGSAAHADPAADTPAALLATATGPIREPCDFLARSTQPTAASRPAAFPTRTGGSLSVCIQADRKGAKRLTISGSDSNR